MPRPLRPFPSVGLGKVRARYIRTDWSSGPAAVLTPLPFPGGDDGWRWDADASPRPDAITSMNSKAHQEPRQRGASLPFTGEQGELVLVPAQVP